MFTTAATDLAWLRDRAFWAEYLTELAAHRFNRFSLGFGAGYDYLIDRRVTDNYLCLPYPFLVDVHGHSVTARGVSAEERAQNLAALQYVGAEASRRGIDFGLGLWNHAYRYDPDADCERWPIRGLDLSNHAAYCRDALGALLEACPDVQRLTFRVHFEGGVPEPTHDFWRVVLSGLPRLSRSVELDFHAKGVSDELIEIATEVGMPLTLSTKHWGEHQGLPYHQASIREKERGHARVHARIDNRSAPGTGHPEPRVTGTETTSRRNFTRYGYGDYAVATRPYGLVHRVWPGTQRILLWGDPTLAAGYGRHADFAGALGIEWFEPMSILGKKDSAAIGSPGKPRTSRALYRDPALQAACDDWRKFRYTYRLLGRTAYDPDVPVADLLRSLTAAYGDAAPAVARALGAASRILPLITVAHAPSTACNVYWPEIPTPVPLVPRTTPAEHPLRAHGWPPNSDFDMTPPYAFGNVSPLDPELIYGVDEFAADLRNGDRQPKHSPPDIADRLDLLAHEALDGLVVAERNLTDVAAPEFTVLVTDVRIQARLAQHFAAMTRAAVAFALRDLGPDWAHRAMDHYRSAIVAWDELVAAAGPYTDDLPFGQTDYSRGSWADRKPAMLADLTSVQAVLEALATAGSRSELSEDSLRPHPAPRGDHQPTRQLVPGQPLPVAWRTSDARVTAVRVHYRPTNQALDYQVAELVGEGGKFRGEIPAEATKAGYPVQYFFELRSAGGEAWPSPGLEGDLTNQPYYVVHADADTRWGRHDYALRPVSASTWPSAPPP
jgi:hypothetical protein